MYFSPYIDIYSSIILLSTAEQFFRKTCWNGDGTGQIDRRFGPGQSSVLHHSSVSRSHQRHSCWSAMGSTAGSMTNSSGTDSGRLHQITARAQCSCGQEKFYTHLFNFLGQSVYEIFDPRLSVFYVLWV